MDNNIEKRIQSLRERLTYLRDIFAGKHKDNAELLEEKLTAFAARARAGELEDPYADLSHGRGPLRATWSVAWKAASRPWTGAHRAPPPARLPAGHPGKRL